MSSPRLKGEEDAWKMKIVHTFHNNSERNDHLDSRAVFFNLFFLAAPFLAKFQFQWNPKFGGTPSTSSRQPSVAQHPCWEPLL